MLAGCTPQKFMMCDNNCFRRHGFLDFISKGYFPSSAVKPKFALKINVIELFHEMYMKGPSSKQTFCYALQRLLQKQTEEVVRIISSLDLTPGS
jgi:hypothetical protein